MKYSSVQDLGIVLGLGLLGAKMGIFDQAYGSYITKTEFLLSNKVDRLYFIKWLDAALAYDFIEIVDDKIYLNELGKTFAKENEDNQLANLIQGVYSVLISNEAISFLETGERPGYIIVDTFKNIEPWYNYVNQRKNEPLLDEIFSNDLFLSMTKNVKGNIADFSCGNGWFLEHIGKQFSNCKLYGINGKISNNELITLLSTTSFLQNNNTYSIIVLNKVLHHIWDDDVLIKKILNKLDPSGILLLWEFSWSDELKKNKKFRETIFLNFIEHIQNAAYISEDAINSKLIELGFASTSFTIDNGAQTIYIVKKAISPR